MAARRKKRAARLKKPTVLQPVRVSAIVQRDYRTELQASNQKYKTQVDRKVNKLLNEIEALDRTQPDAFQRQAARIQKEIGGLQRNLNAANKRSEAAVRKFVRGSKRENFNRTIKSFGKKVDPKAASALLKERAPLVDKRSARLQKKYVESITRANRDYSDRVQAALYEKLGNPRVNARKKITKARGIVTRRIKNTVKDQSHELNATLNRARQPALGAKRYKWQTREDELVRPSHREANKKIFAWNKKPLITGGFHAGEDFGCRCRAIPVFD